MIAALFLLTAATSIFGAFALEPGLYAADYLSKIFPEQGDGRVERPAVVVHQPRELSSSRCSRTPCSGRLDEALAIGYLASRIIESAVMMVGIVAALLLIPVSQQFLAAGAPQNSWFQTLGAVLLQAKLLGLTLLSLPLLGLGGLFFTWLLFRFRLVPRLIAVVGLIGYGLLIPAGIAGLFGLVDPSPTGNVAFLALPVAVFEIILLPFWLLFRGFKMPETTS